MYNALLFFCFAGVVTYCKKAVCPVAAEEGLTGLLNKGKQSKKSDFVGCYPSWDEKEDSPLRNELLDLDSEGWD